MRTSDASETTAADMDRDELRQRARKALTYDVDNDYARGWYAAWSEVLHVLDAQDEIRRIAGTP